ncbi:hypothetical protein RDWZM_009509 [Blomia tropicalis]|uniref:Signal recognition particle 14 kDa protein n=1 Tax=Blomia tropicalis TaxID=40697 RepID=A0A9Q0M5E2_BLOTA|nr:RNA-binding signal recognition particle subunit srp14 [Blomia tropicalis]KAJ6218352.1 hypothetical protein RDWZM_009509 [Blomia tropicalis]
MLIINNETFLSEMSKLFASNQSKGGSIYITMKRIDNSKKPTPRPIKPSKKKKKQTKQPQSQPKQDETSTKPNENMCLIRVHNNTRKISTVVNAKDVNKFQQAYSNLLRGNLYGLKKKEKKKTNKKSKATQ